MLLVIDIGNTFTKFGVFEDALLFRRVTTPTVRQHNADEIHNPALPREIQAIVISSVVPELNNSYREFSQTHFKLEPIFVDNTFDFGLKIKYYPPEALGVDRLVAAFAAAEKYGKPCIVCDFGTATTIDAVSSQGEFLGGAIAPGMKTLEEALFLKTSKLPRVDIKKPDSVIGNSTVGSIQSGIFFGYIGLVDGILNRMIAELDHEKPKIVATGGFAPLISQASELIETVDESLVLDGLRLIHQKLFQKHI